MLEAQGRLAQSLQRRDRVSAVALLLGGRGRVVVLALAIGQSQSGGHRRMVSGASLEDCASGQDHQRPPAEAKTIDEVVSQALRDGEFDQRAQARFRFGEIADAEVPGQLGLVLDRTTGLELGGLVQAALFAKGVPQGDRQDDPPSTARCGGGTCSPSWSILPRAFRPVLVSRRLVICTQAISQATDLTS